MRTSIHVLAELSISALSIATERITALATKHSFRHLEADVLSSSGCNDWKGNWASDHKILSEYHHLTVWILYNRGVLSICEMDCVCV